MKKKLTVGISNRHAHLTQTQLDMLFGKGYVLTFNRNILQRDEFVSNETIDIIGPKGSLKNIRIMGPTRDVAQIELSLTDAFQVGVEGNVRISRDVKGTSAIRLVGPCGECQLNEGVIIPLRHIHISPNDAKALNLWSGKKVCVETKGERGLIFKNVVVRIDDDFIYEFHIDRDEANAAGLSHGDEVFLIHQ